MSSSEVSVQKWALASVALQDAFTDFILSRQAILCSPKTIGWYRFNLGKFIQWLETNGVVEPSEITARHIRAYLSNLVERGLSDTYIHGHARTIRTLTKFLHSEKYIGEEIKFQMPSISHKGLHTLTAEQLKKVLALCKNPRDLALVMLMTDTGIRRAELCALNWEDIDISSGLVRIKKGKGGKARSVVVGVKTRRAMLKYRRSVNADPEKPTIQTQTGGRFTFGGLRSVLLRLGKQAGVKLAPHALRRTFATLSLRAGMNPLHLQGLLGHASLEMTERYVQMLEDDLVTAHQKHGPIDNL